MSAEASAVSSVVANVPDEASFMSEEAVVVEAKAISSEEWQDEGTVADVVATAAPDPVSTSDLAKQFLEAVEDTRGAAVPSLRACAVLRSLLRARGAGALTARRRARGALFSSKS